MEVQRALNFARRHRRRFLDELVEFVRFPSISAAPRHARDASRAARRGSPRIFATLDWTACEVVPTERHPVVYGEWRQLKGHPTLLVYGHYDVQPVDPVAAWRTAFFEPTIEGATTFMAAARPTTKVSSSSTSKLDQIPFWQGGGRLPINVQCVFEGEEEIGGPNCVSFIVGGEFNLAPNAIVISDMAMVSPKAAGRSPTAHVAISRSNSRSQGRAAITHSGVFGGGRSRSTARPSARLSPRSMTRTAGSRFKGLRSRSQTERSGKAAYAPVWTIGSEAASGTRKPSEVGASAAHQRMSARLPVRR